MESGGEWQLVHKAPPGENLAAGASQRSDGAWIYRTVKARELWQQIMQSTYGHAEPGEHFPEAQQNSENDQTPRCQPGCARRR